MLKIQNKRKKSGVLSNQSMIVLPVVLFALLTWALWWLYPNISSILLAFQDVKGEFTTYNFEEVWRSLTLDGGTLGVSLRNTLIIFMMSIFVRIPLVVFVVYFFFKRIPGHKFFRIAFYLPAIIPAIALTGTFKNFISVTGPLGKICSELGIIVQNEGFLNTAETAFTTVCIYIVWTCVSGGLLVINGAMIRIPPEVLESAKIEGCGMMRELVQIILPLIWPTISTLIILACTGIIAAGGDTVMLLSNSPQLNQTITLHYWMFKRVYGNGMGSGEYGVVSAMGLIFTCVLIPFTITVRKLLGRVQAVEY